MKERAVAARTGGTPHGKDQAQLLRDFWALWLGEQPFLKRHARALATRSGTDADDLTEEALLRAISATLRGAGPQREPRTWLKSVLERTTVDQHRRRRRFENADPSALLEGIEGPSPTPEMALLSRESQRRLSRAFASLPRPLRTALELRVVESYSYESVARALRISTPNARKRVQLARSLLRVDHRNRRTSGRRSAQL